MHRSKQTLSSVRSLASLLLSGSNPPSPTSHQILPKFNPQIHPFIQSPRPPQFSSQPDPTAPDLHNLPNFSHENPPPSITYESTLYILKKLHKTPPKALAFFQWVSDNKPTNLSPSAYSLMLRILGHRDSISEFWSIAREMSDRGIELDTETYRSLSSNFSMEKMPNEVAALAQFFKTMVEKSTSSAAVAAAVEILSGSDWGDEVEKKLGGLNLVPSEVTVPRILRDTRGEPSRALSFFRWVAEKRGFTHNSITYNAMVRVLGREDSIEMFWSVVDEMKKEGHEIDIDTYVKVLRQFMKRKMMKEAVELYEVMMKGPYKPSQEDCAVLLRQISLCENPVLDLVFKVVGIYEASGHSLSKAVYDGIHRSLTSVGRFDEAEKILKAMRDAGFGPDNITYSQVVFGLCKAGRLDEACKMLDEMEGLGCLPDLKTWTILIQGHCHAGEIDKALSCLTKMMEKGLDADADLLDVLVDGLCSKNRINSAYTLVVEMVDKARLRPWQATHKYLIQKLLGEGKLEEALKLLSLMKSHNFPPFPDPFYSYISKFGTVADAMDFLKTLTVKKFPNVSVYLHVFESFLKECRYSEAQELFYKCPHHIRNHADIVKLFSSTNVAKAA